MDEETKELLSNIRDDLRIIRAIMVAQIPDEFITDLLSGEVEGEKELFQELFQLRHGERLGGLKSFLVHNTRDKLR